jgi:hypothetical protein
MRGRLLIVLLCLGTATPAQADEIDSDRDGLSDFHETHKYFTNPKSADSDGDGIPDGDWHERREFTYTIRSVVKVMRPCDASVVNDDYQDARVLSESEAWVELEVVHYPFNTNAAAIDGSREWQKPAPELKAYLEPGFTTNWDDSMRRNLIAALKADGIDLSGMTDRQVVERVAAWLLARGKYRYMFGTYFVHFPEGKAQIFPGLEDAFRNEQGNTDLPFEKHLQHEVFGKGMYENKCYGTCTSTAIYLTTGLRAVGIPTRMILAIPPADGSDPRQIRMIKEHIANHQVRRTLLSGQPAAGFAAHTFNEVYVGGRWRRLNYNKLGQNSYGPGAMGMLTHVLTFRDLSEAGLTETWGRRYGRGERDDVFQGSNPYRLTEISDRFGIHSRLENTPVEEPSVAPISKAYWFFSDERPNWIPSDSVKPKADGHLLVHVDLDLDDLKVLYPKLDKHFKLVAAGQPTIRAQAERGFWNEECYVRIPPDEFARMAPGVPYRLAPAKTDGPHRWRVEDNVRIVKTE